MDLDTTSATFAIPGNNAPPRSRISSSPRDLKIPQPLCLRVPPPHPHLQLRLYTPRVIGYLRKCGARPKHHRRRRSPGWCRNRARQVPHALLNLDGIALIPDPIARYTAVTGLPSSCGLPTAYANSWMRKRLAVGAGPCTAPDIGLGILSGECDNDQLYATSWGTPS